MLALVAGKRQLVEIGLRTPMIAVLLDYTSSNENLCVEG